MVHLKIDIGDRVTIHRQAETLAAAISTCSQKLVAMAKSITYEKWSDGELKHSQDVTDYVKATRGAL